MVQRVTHNYSMEGYVRTQVIVHVTKANSQLGVKSPTAIKGKYHIVLHM